MPTLPTEAYEHIIDELAILPPVWPETPFLGLRKQRVALWTCCLVCRDWLPRARLLLYRVALVDVHSIPCFASCLVARPSNGCMTTHLLLTGERTDSAKGDSLSLLPLLLPRHLPAIIHLGFIEVDFTTHHASFYRSMRLFSGVRGIIWYRSTFSSPWQIVRLAQSFTSLKEMQVLGPRHNIDGGELQDKHENILQVPAISLMSFDEPSSSSNFWPMPFLCSGTTIVDLSLFHPESQDFSYSQYLLRKCRPMLRSLTLEISNRSYLDPPFERNDLYPSLERLRIYHDVEPTQLLSRPAALDQLDNPTCRFLREIETPSLKTMEVVLVVHPIAWNSSDFETLESILCKSNFAACEDICLRMYRYHIKEASQSLIPPNEARTIFPTFALQRNARFFF